MQTAADPCSVFELLIRGIREGRWGGLAELYAEDAVVELPMALPAPLRLEGRAALRGHFEAAASGGLALEVRDLTVRETADPEVVVAEYAYVGRVAATGRVFRAANVQVVRVRDGLIAASRDYHDHAVLAAAAGRLPQVVAALGGPVPPQG